MSEWVELPRSTLYGWIVLIGILVGGWFWSRKWKERPASFPIFIGAILGAFLGAKILFLVAEGWAHLDQPSRWMIWLSGKTILGALLGGYAAVELVKRWVGHTEPTGDWFAVGVPISIAIGRIGCLRYGCCPGVPFEGPDWFTLDGGAEVDRWPAVPLELLFNLAFVAIILPFALRGAGRGQLFHCYLVGYGCFRLWHEAYRDTPKMGCGISVYQVAAFALVCLGLVRGWQRWRSHSGKDQPPGETTCRAEEHEEA